MAYRIHVYMLNPHFSQEHADAQHEGQETENNKILDWEDEFVINEVELPPEETVNGTYHLRGMKGESEAFDIEIQKMRLFDFKNEAGQLVQIVCSEELYNQHEIDATNQTMRLTLNGEPYANPIVGVYIASLDFPAELIGRD